MDKQEIWKAIPGYEGFYEVSSLGNVKSLKRLDSIGRKVRERILKKVASGSGYFNVFLCVDTKIKAFSVHRLVAMAFLGHTPDGTHKIVVDHINNTKKDNRLENLQLVTNRVNTSKDQKGGTSKYLGVSWSKTGRKWQASICISGKHKHLGYFTEELEASGAYNTELRGLSK